MKILGMGMPELLIILAVILLIFGPKNLPKLGGAIGKTVKNLRDGMGGSKKAIEDADEEEDGEEEADLDRDLQLVLDHQCSSRERLFQDQISGVSMSTRWPPEVTTQRVAAYRHFEKPTPNGRSSAAVAASQPDS